MKWSVIGLVLVGLVAAVAVTFIFAEYRTSGSLKDIFRPKEDKRTVTYIVAKTDLPGMTILDGEKIESVEELVSDAPDVVRESVRKDPVVHFAHTEDLLGGVLKLDVPAGKPLLRGDLVKGRLDVQLEAEERAVAVPLDNYTGLRGILRAGSLVDVIASFRSGTSGSIAGRAYSTRLLRSKQVLGVNEDLVVSDPDEEEEKKKSSRSTSGSRSRVRVILRVSVEEAKMLWLAQGSGKLSLALRNPLHQGDDPQEDEPVWFPPTPWEKEMAVQPIVSRPATTRTGGTGWTVDVFHGPKKNAYSFPQTPQEAGSGGATESESPPESGAQGATE